MPLQSLATINAKNRNSSVDIFRALAILGVVFFHFNNSLSYGFLGVDLFFVISGLLVGGLLTKKYAGGEKISFFKFILQRGFKIWPSYFIFLLAGNVISYFIYRNLDPSQIIPLREYPKYLFFYKNFAFEPVHGGFDQVWSLCIEEHFYILLAIGFILIQRFNASKRTLFLYISAAIILSIILKVISLYYTRSGDTTFKTHTRIDALAWGVLLNLIVTYYPLFLKNIKRPYLIFLTGLGIFCTTMFIEVHTTSIFFHQIVLHAVVPFSFFLMLLGAYNYNFSKLKVLQFIAYYSYNWYLWHPLLIVALFHYVGKGILSISLYVVLSFIIAILATTFIEEPFLRLRKRLFSKADVAFQGSGVLK